MSHLEQRCADYQRIERAIRYLEAHFRQQPNLRDLAEHLRMSEFHLQRLFKRWVGISPKRFLQFLTKQYAKSLLEQHHTVLDTTLQAGLSSPGRLHDLLVTTEAVTPGEVGARGRGLTIRYGMHPSPFGPCLLAVTERGICWLAFASPDGREEPLQALKSYWRQAKFVEDSAGTFSYIERIFPQDGQPRQRLPLYLKGTNFQLKVWEALLRVPAGRVTTYGEIARFLGDPRASRAVGAAVGRNPISYLIPCHRVLRKLGALGGYRWGLPRKRAILAWEAALVETENR